MEINTDGYRAEGFERLGPDLLYHRRHVTRHRTAMETYAFGPHWTLILADFAADTLVVCDADTLVPVVGRRGLLLPPFSIFRYRVRPATIVMDCFDSERSLPSHCPTAPAFFTRLDDRVPRSSEEVFAVLARARDWREFRLDLHAPAIVKRARRRITETFSESRSILEVSRELHVSHAVMSRHFKRVYGFSPVAYRNRVRVMHSLWLLMSQSTAVTEAGLAAGFDNLSNFNRQFKREVRTAPSTYQLEGAS